MSARAEGGVPSETRDVRRPALVEPSAAMRAAVAVHVEHEETARNARERRRLEDRLVELGGACAKGGAR